MQKFFLSLTVSALLLAACAAAQNLPAGTREADAPSPQEAINTQIRSAESALESGDYAAAITALKPLAAAQPKNAHILYDLGFAQEHTGDDTAAAASYKAAIAADPTFAEPQLALGLIDARNGRVDAAHRELQAASNLSDADPVFRARALRSLAILDEHTDPDASRDELLEALKLTPETPADILLAARLAEHANAFPEAEAAYRRLLAIIPNDPDATAGLAHALAAQGKTDRRRGAPHLRPQNRPCRPPPPLPARRRLRRGGQIRSGDPHDRAAPIFGSERSFQSGHHTASGAPVHTDG